jgi:hypothetical protein
MVEGCTNTTPPLVFGTHITKSMMHAGWPQPSSTPPLLGCVCLQEGSMMCRK